MKYDWLTTPADTWEEDVSDRNAQRFASSVKIANDVAEKCEAESDRYSDQNGPEAERLLTTSCVEPQKQFRQFQEHVPIHVLVISYMTVDNAI